MKIQALANLLFIVLSSFTFQLKAQEIDTREDAFNYIKRTYKSFKMGQDGVGNYRIDGIKMENECLLFEVRKHDYKMVNGYYEYFYGPTQYFILDFSDSLKLKEKKTTWGNHDKYWCIEFKQINNFYGAGDKEKKKESMEEFYKALKILGQTRKTNETQEFKLAELRKGKLTNPKTEISEEQRKYIVQANAETENKNYNEAISLFNKAIKINPYTYPFAYYNMALIHGNLENYYQAVFAMKQYLILAPEAEDARKAQDKIYEWELKLIY